MTDEEKQKALKDALALAENESDYHHRRCREARRDLEWHTREMERCDVTVKALKELVSAPIAPHERRREDKHEA